MDHGENTSHQAGDNEDNYEIDDEQVPMLRQRPRRWPWLLAVPVVLCVLLVVACGPPAVLTDWWDQRSAAQPDPQEPPIVAGASSIISRQAAALLAGDEAGWMAAVQAGNAPLRERYRSLYANLRGLGVTRFQAVTPQDGPGPVEVTIAYCLASGWCCQTDPSCTVPADRFVDIPKTRWTVTFTAAGDGMVITDLRTSEISNFERDPAPWEGTALTIQSGARTIVAAPPQLTGIVPQALAAAEAAAAVADNYTGRWGKPRRYVIYLATEEQFSKVWFGGKAPGETDLAGYAAGNGVGLHHEVVLRTPYGLDLDVLMRHELGHVATLHGSHRNESHRWLVEGIAEYVAYQGQPSTANPRTKAVKAFVADGWTGDLTRPVNKTGGPGNDAAYGLAHFATACLADQYGSDAMLAFFDAVVRQGVDYDKAARQSLAGAPWAQVNTQCSGQIRRQLA